MRTKQLLFLALFSAPLAGCGGSDPYEGRSTVPVGTKQAEQPPPPQAPPPPHLVPLPSLSLSIPDTLPFTELQESQYTFTASVNKGDLLVEIENLPAGVLFDKQNLVLVWAPAKDPAHPGQRVFPIIVHVRSSADLRNELARTVMLIVSPGGTP